MEPPADGVPNPFRDANRGILALLKISRKQHAYDFAHEQGIAISPAVDGLPQASRWTDSWSSLDELFHLFLCQAGQLQPVITLSTDQVTQGLC